MSLSHLLEDKPKPWCNARVNNLVADNDLLVSGDTFVDDIEVTGTLLASGNVALTGNVNGVRIRKPLEITLYHAGDSVDNTIASVSTKQAFDTNDLTLSTLNELGEAGYTLTASNVNDVDPTITYNGPEDSVANISYNITLDITSATPTSLAVNLLVSGSAYLDQMYSINHFEQNQSTQITGNISGIDLSDGDTIRLRVQSLSATGITFKIRSFYWSVRCPPVTEF